LQYPAQKWWRIRFGGNWGGCTVRITRVASGSLAHPDVASAAAPN
jgi:hypothetical protein